MQSKQNDLLAKIKNALKEDLLEFSTDLNELSITVPKDMVAKVLLYLRDAESVTFNQLMDICGVDYLGREKRFDVVYHLLSLPRNQRIRVKIQVDEDDLVPSVVNIFSCANWFEREVWDMFGIRFSNHPDLRRILTDYGFDGFPLRKDFPLSGYTEVRYDDKQKRIVHEPVNLAQEFRDFDFLSPWEGMTIDRFALPGDEKAEPKRGDD